MQDCSGPLGAPAVPISRVIPIPRSASAVSDGEVPTVMYVPRRTLLCAPWRSNLPVLASRHAPPPKGESQFRSLERSLYLMTITSFEDLQVWRSARRLIQSILRACHRTSLAHDRILKEQMQRAALSVLSNIAEGFESDSDRQFVRYLRMAKSSAGELRGQLYVALDGGHLTKEQFAAIHGQALEVSRQLGGLIKYLTRKSENDPVVRRG